MNESIFREYDVRGIVGDDLTDEVVHTIARAFGTLLRRKGKKTVAVGRDVRLSSEGFAAAVCRGFAETGLDVLDAGVVPTPVLYYAILSRECDGGIMITGSHNPVEYNGLKICEGTLAMFGDEIQEVRRTAEAGRFETGEGSVTAVDILPVYLEDLVSRFSYERSYKVVVDCGNGVAGPTVPGILRSLGHEVVELYTEPDGSFPNHLPDPEVPEYMKDLVAKVKEVEADIGLGFDGDGDRLGVIDENGRKLSADWLLALFARDMLERHPGGIIRFDVKCSDFLAEDVRAHGGEPVMGRTGHSILKRDIKESGAILGGELSGHIVFGREYYVIDDPMFCALRTLELMEKSDSTCSALFTGFPETFSTAEIKALVTPESRKFELVEELTKEFAEHHEVIAVDGARVLFEDGWGLVRASNTTANLTLRFESRSQEGLERIRGEFLRRMEKHEEIDLAKVREAF